MLTAIAQSVEINTLKTSASLPIQIRIRRSTSGEAARLRNAMASPSHTSAIDRRCWRASAKYVTRAPMVISLPGRAKGGRVCSTKHPSRDRALRGRQTCSTRVWASAGTQRAVQIEPRADQGEIGDSLRKGSQGLAPMPGLFRIEAEMGGEPQPPPENQCR